MSDSDPKRLSEASNDVSYGTPGGHFTAEEVVNRLLPAVDAPTDLPDGPAVLTQVQLAIATLAHEVPGASVVAQRIGEAEAAMEARVAPGAVIVSLSQRIGRHLAYAMLREISARRERGEHIEETALKTVAAWAGRGLITGWQPRPVAISKVRAALVRPGSSQALNWSARGRVRTLERALLELRKAIDANPRVSRSLGFVPQGIVEVKQRTPIDVFNDAFRRRANSLRTLSSMRAVAGASGHGALSAGGLLDAGTELLNGVCAMDTADLLPYLETLSHLPGETAVQMPVVLRGSPPAGALAWIELETEAYCYVLFRLMDRGAKLPAGQENRFERSTQVVTIRLSPPAVGLMRRRCAAMPVSHASNWVPLGEVLGDVVHHPRATVAGSGPYRVTARRMQEALPPILLQRGGHRWPILLATGSPFLVAPGRDSYGVAWMSSVQRQVDEAHVAMGWPTAGFQGMDSLVGARTVPTRASISAMVNALADQADRVGAEMIDLASVKRSINGCAPWAASMLSLCLALRKRLQYLLPSRQLQSGTKVKFDDKHVHDLDPVALPVCRTLAEVVRGWIRLCRAAVAILESLEDAEAHRLAGEIRTAIDAVDSWMLVFTIDPADRLMPVGWHTWHDAIPGSLRLPGNFARQFWPLQMMNRGLEQRLLDVLMRHQLAGLHLGASHSMVIGARLAERLRVALDGVIEELELRFPAFWRAGDE